MQALTAGDDPRADRDYEQSVESLLAATALDGARLLAYEAARSAEPR